MRVLAMRVLVLSFILFFLCKNLFCQTQELIKGIVADSATFSPLPYVNIEIKNSTRGATTDMKGNFSFLASRNDTVLISFVGYKTLELTLRNWEPSVILLSEQATTLESITITGTVSGDPYEYLFEEENKRLEEANKKAPFYYSRDKKEKIKLENFRSENQRVKVYVDLVVKNQEFKNDMIKKYKLSENEFYSILSQFNDKNYKIMYYLTASELLSLLNRFYEIHAAKK